MARIRTVKPEFWQHPKVTRVSRDARLLFLGLLNEADDEGKLRYSPKRLAGVLFCDDVDVDADLIALWVYELECACLVRQYEVDGACLLIVPGFTEHQSINRPTQSRLPNPPDFTREGSVSDQGDLPGGREQGTGNGRGSSGGAAPDIRVKELVGGYIEDYGAERSGRRPSGAFIGACGKAVKSALKDDVSVEDIARCLGVIAHESKNPSTLPYVLADYHAGRERRMK